MSTLQKKTNTPLNEIKSFTYPKLYIGVEWYIGFMAFDPVRNNMRRKRIKINFIEKAGERRKYADGLMKRLIKKLEDGWNPWIESENEKAYHTFADVCRHYKKHITKLEADGILRPDTYRDYTSQLRNIEKWNTEKKDSIVYIYQFDRIFITDLLEEMYIERGNSAVTRNNYLSFIRTFCNFLLNHQYIQVNPSEGVAFISKKKMKKIRTVIEEKDILQLCEYLEINNKYFLLACYILHYCFVRPKEMSFIKLSDISIRNQTLFISGEHSKNRDSATVTIPEKVIHLMIELKVFDNPSEFYLFSDNFKPGRTYKYSKQFTDYWALTIRKQLKFPMKYQFYSLKDTGITEMLRRYDTLTVRDQARHSSIEMTNKYTPHDVVRANPLITKHKGVF